MTRTLAVAALLGCCVWAGCADEGSPIETDDAAQLSTDTARSRDAGAAPQADTYDDDMSSDLPDEVGVESDSGSGADVLPTDSGEDNGDQAVDTLADGPLAVDLDDEEEASAPTYSDVPFTVIDGVELAEWIGRDDARVLLRTAPEFEAALGVAPPEVVSFETEWVLFHSVGARPVPGHITTVTGLQVEDSGSELLISTNLTQPGGACETFSYSRGTTQLVRFDQIAGFAGALNEDRTTSTVDCSTSGAAEFEECDDAKLCEPSLLCAGFTRSDSGMCMPVSQRGEFSIEVEAPIPDDGTPLTQSMVTSGLTTVDMDVVITLSLTHQTPSELTITLTNPSSNETMVWNEESHPGGAVHLERPPTGFSGDESVNGTWVLSITDDSSGNSGVLHSWGLEIMSRWD